MGVKVATTCLQWSHLVYPYSSSSSQTLASVVWSPSSRQNSRRRKEGGGGGGGGGRALLTCKVVHQGLFGSQSKIPHRFGSSELHILSRSKTTTVQCSASFNTFSEDEFSEKMRELALKFEFEEGDDNYSWATASTSLHGSRRNLDAEFVISSVEPPWRDMMHESCVQWKANSIDLPLSLRMIKRKMQWECGFENVRETACCSIKKAFSSMVFMIRELQSFTLQMRESLYYEDLQEILHHVHKEMQASFVWLFQQVFSATPTLMVYVMILLANFTVYSMGTNAGIAVAASPPLGSYSATTEIFITHVQKNQNIDSSLIKTFLVSSGGKAELYGGKNGGGGGTVKPTASNTDGDEGSDRFGSVGFPELSLIGSTREAATVLRKESESKLWKLVVEEAERLQALLRDESLDHETMKNLVAPVDVKIEADDFVDYRKTDLLYQMELAQEPSNPLLLANYAQFLYIAAHDYDRAEEFFKKAVEILPADAESYSKYATFLWKVRKDLWAAEETFLEAINADPTNSHYTASYAHFLWNTGGEDTCYPLNSSPETLYET